MTIHESDDSAADFLGHYIGNYRLLRLLGRGGAASVYLGEHRYLKRLSAIKILRTALNERDKERFLKEARLLANLSHPYIVRVLEFEVAQKVNELGNGEFTEYIPYLVMDFAPGGSLRALYSASSYLPPNIVVGSIKQIAAALQYAHDNGIIHRDVKPENCLLNKQQEVMLTDFGLALFAPAPDLLSTQQMAGTLPYAAPEQLRGKPGFASDQYSLGIMAYEWLCGHRPFEGEDLELIIQHMSSPPPPLRSQNSRISQAIEEVVLKALAKDPRQRYPSVQAFASALERASQWNPSNFSPYSHITMKALSPGQWQGSTISEPFSSASEGQPVYVKTEKRQDEEETYTPLVDQVQTVKLSEAQRTPQNLSPFSLKREKKRSPFIIGIVASILILVLGSTGTLYYLKTFGTSSTKARPTVTQTPVAAASSTSGTIDFTVTPARTHGITLVTDEAIFGGDHAILDANQQVVADFMLSDSAASGISKPVSVSIRALVARLGNSAGYAPIDVYCNGQSVVQNFTIPGNGFQPEETSFQIPPGSLVQGKNEMRFLVSSNAQSVLWLYSIGITPVSPSPVASPPAGQVFITIRALLVLDQAGKPQAARCSSQGGTATIPDGYNVVAVSNDTYQIGDQTYVHVAYPDPCQAGMDYSPNNTIANGSGAVGWVAQDALVQAKVVRLRLQSGGSALWHDCWEPNRCADSSYPNTTDTLVSSDSVLYAWWAGSYWDVHWWHVLDTSGKQAAVYGRDWGAFPQ